MVELVNDNRKIGIALTGFGCLFLLLGVVLFFDKGLLALGNVLFLAGITLLIGLRKTMFFFVRRDKWRGTVCFLGGMVTVLVGWPVVGMLVEMVGILNLFANFFPIIISFLRQFPVMGTILNLPVVRTVVDRLGGDILPVYRGSD